MGIKFFCPNGHKLNVKAFLAGKRGICPHCGAKMMIPTESQRGPDARVPGGGQVAAMPATALPTTAMPATAMPAAAMPAATVAQLPPAAAALPDPVAQNPSAVWYVRPSTGGQYGPADGESIHRWLAEGRVNAESLVWQEGWPDWRKAGDVFPQFANY